jgi:hypothetical protein
VHDEGKNEKKTKTKKTKNHVESSLVLCDSPKLRNDLIWNSEYDPTFDQVTQSLSGKMQLLVGFSL